jgi:hypothetical protein
MRARDAQDLSGEREISLSQMELLLPMVDGLYVVHVSLVCERLS